MQRLLSTLALSLAAVLCLASDERSAAPAGQTAPDTTTAVIQETETTAAAAPSVRTIPKTKEGAEVVAVGSSGLTVKLDGKETTLPVRGKADAALKLVIPGDKVRLFYVEEDAGGQPKAVMAFTITDPVQKDLTKKSEK